MSEDSNQSKAASSSMGSLRFRSRFPKAQPNLAISSGLARIRKISGHFSDTKECENHTELAQAPASPAPTLTRQLIDSVLSPKPIAHDDDVSKSPMKRFDEPHLTPGSPSVTFRQLINNPSVTSSPVHHIHSVSQPGTPLIVTPSGTVPVVAYLNNSQAYSPQFSKEHIMNIIKYKAMQKLKKIESENLREKRRKNKKSSALLKQVQEQSVLSTDDASHKVDKSKLRMRDFLYFNPRVAKKSESTEAIPEASNEQILGSLTRSSSSLSLSLHSENDTNDTPESVSSKSSVYSAVRPAPPPPPKAPVSLAPQLRISEDGTIVINEESLVIQREALEPVYESTVVESEHGDNLTYNSYRKFHHTKKWTERETAKFYKALSMVGTDFTMIQKFFSHRNRDEIKRKFKREEKINQALIDKILSKTVSIDLSFFVSSSGEDAEEHKGEQSKKKKSKSINKKSDDEASRSNVSNAANENPDTKKKSKLKRIQKRAFVDSESDTDSNSKKSLVQTQTSIVIEEKNSQKAQTDENTRHVELTEIVVEEPALEAISTIALQPSTSMLFESNRETFELINEQIQIEEKRSDDAKESDSDEIELVFDLDTEIIDEKRKVDRKEVEEEVAGNQVNEGEKADVKKDKAEDDDDDDSEIILDLDNNTIIRNSQLGTSSITITKIKDKQ